MQHPANAAQHPPSQPPPPEDAAPTAEPQRILANLAKQHRLSEREAERVFESVLSGGYDSAQIGALLALIAARGPTVDELVGAARVMRRNVKPVEPPTNTTATLVDTAGTGGAPKLFNISTAAAIVAAAAAPGRIMIAKHGSKSRTSRGSAELAAAIGINLDASPQTQSKCLKDPGVCFTYAINHHPAMQHAAGPRKSLGFATIFNLLGPLTNPAGAKRQLLGAYDRQLAHALAHTLARLGAEHAMIVISHDGYDELTTTNTNEAHEVRNGRVETRIIDPQALGLPKRSPDQLAVNTIEEATDAITQSIAGIDQPRAEQVVLNAAATLYVGAAAETIEEGVKLAKQAIQSGAATQTLRRLVEQSNQPD